MALEGDREDPQEDQEPPREDQEAPRAAMGPETVRETGGDHPDPRRRMANRGPMRHHRRGGAREAEGGGEEEEEEGEGWVGGELVGHPQVVGPGGPTHRRRPDEQAGGRAAADVEQAGSKATATAATIITVTLLLHRLPVVVVVVVDVVVRIMAALHGGVPDPLLGPVGAGTVAWPPAGLEIWRNQQLREAHLVPGGWGARAVL